MGMTLREVTWLAVLLRITTAFLLGGLLGMERGLKQRPAGLRTYMLVCMGACIIMMTNQYMVQVFGTGDVARMGAQVVSGIGFLGAGTIMVTRNNQVRGLTTAAGLWAAAGVGLATGIGFYEAAIAGAVAIFITLSLLSNLDDRMHRKTDHFDVYAELSPDVSLGMLMEALEQQRITIDDVQLDTRLPVADGGRSYLLQVSTSERFSRAELLAMMQQGTQQAGIMLNACRIL